MGENKDPFLENERLVKHLESLGKKDITVTLGITPNYEPHVGNIYTIVHGIYAVNQICGDMGIHPRFIVGFNDYELDFSKDVDNPSVLLLTKPEEVSNREHTLQELVDCISKEFEAEVELSVLSELQSQPAFRTLLNIVRSNQAFAFLSNNFEDFFKLYLVLNCDHAFHLGSKIANEEVNTNYIFVCNADCDEQYELKTPINYRDVQLGITCGVVGSMKLRDVYFGADVHIAGGKQLFDEDHRWFSIPEFLGVTPHFYKTGCVYNIEDENMSKSGDFAIALDTLGRERQLIWDIVELGKKSGHVINYADYKHLI